MMPFAVGVHIFERRLSTEVYLTDVYIQTLWRYRDPNPGLVEFITTFTWSNQSRAPKYTLLRSFVKVK